MSDDPFVISGMRLRCLIQNAHRLLGRKYSRCSLWGLVSDLTGNGSSVSCDICKHVGLDPHQLCGVKDLKDYQPSEAK